MLSTSDRLPMAKIRFHNSVLSSVLLLIVVSIFIFYIVRHIEKIKHIREQDANNFSLEPTDGNKPRINCSVVKKLCFTSNDCNVTCSSASQFECINGYCINRQIISDVDTVNECNPERGVLAFLIGDTQFGRYNTICKSIDLGIAPNNPREDNRMCISGKLSTPVNYLSHFPTIDECICNTDTFKYIIPATSSIRKHAVCLNKTLQVPLTSIPENVSQ